MRCNNLHGTVGTDDRTCSEQSERNSETGEFIRYSEASTQNKLCLSHNRALHGHCVFYLLAMSAALDVRKCFALASLFACGQSGYRVRHAQRADMKYPTSVGKRKRHSFECLFFGDPTEVRTRVTAVKGRCLRPLDHRAVYSICISWWKLQDSNL